MWTIERSPFRWTICVESSIECFLLNVASKSETCFDCIKALYISLLRSFLGNNWVVCSISNTVTSIKLYEFNIWLIDFCEKRFIRVGTDWRWRDGWLLNIQIVFQGFESCPHRIYINFNWLITVHCCCAYFHILGEKNAVVSSAPSSAGWTGWAGWAVP